MKKPAKFQREKHGWLKKSVKESCIVFIMVDKVINYCFNLLLLIQEILPIHLFVVQVLCFF